jgi:ribosome-associated heat shock protein Hsp15
MRLDKWLWAARFYKTRGLAQRAIVAGQVKLNDERTKPAHEVQVGDSIVLRKENSEWKIVVRALSERRGPAVQASQLYEETESSKAERERRKDLRSQEPAATIKGRPTKRDRRRLEQLTSDD